jgi:amidase
MSKLYPVAEKSIAALQADMAAGIVDSEGLVHAYLDRIETIDRSGPTLRSVIALNPKALDDARRLDAERRDGKVRGPLHGVPVLVKDNIETDDGTATTAGSLALVDNVTLRDAPVAARLKVAGAVILGKTNLSEWANIRSTGSISGWSAVGGLVKNPYVLDRSPSGSSSGTGAAIAATLAAAGVGTETNGSVISPASVCGLVGLKPTVGLVSRTHIVPISGRQDTWPSCSPPWLASIRPTPRRRPRTITPATTPPPWTAPACKAGGWASLHLPLGYPPPSMRCSTRRWRRCGRRAPRSWCSTTISGRARSAPRPVSP